MCYYSWLRYQYHILSENIVSVSWQPCNHTCVCVCPPSGHPGLPAPQHPPPGARSLPGLPEAQQLCGPDPGARVPADPQHAVSHSHTGQRQCLQVPTLNYDQSPAISNQRPTVWFCSKSHQVWWRINLTSSEPRILMCCQVLQLHQNMVHKNVTGRSSQTHQ